MAIDKNLTPFGPNPAVAGPGAEEVELTEDDYGLDMDNSVVDTPDGGVMVDFSGSGFADEQPGPEFGSNLADFMEERHSRILGKKLLEQVAQDKLSRKAWEEAYEAGYKLLGFKNEPRTEPWNNACGITHPLMAEAAVRFQAQTIMEIFPASGPARTKVVGKGSMETVQQGFRVENFINYTCTETMSEYREEKDRKLLSLALVGSAFMKVYQNMDKDRPEAVFVPASDFIVNWGATSLDTAYRTTHIMRKDKDWVRRNQLNGFYSDIDLPSATEMADDPAMASKTSVGESETNLGDDELRTLYEIHCNVDFESFFDDRGVEAPSWVEPSQGLALPYIVTVDHPSGTVLSIRRNWREEDPGRNKRMHFTHYQYVPSDGFYGYGLMHLIGGVSEGATAILRMLVDAGTVSNLPSGFKLRSFRTKGDQTPFRPAEWRDVDLPPGTKLQDSLYPLPYKEPSEVLFRLLGSIIEEGRRFASLADMDIPNSGSETPVGTTLAVIERSMKVMSAVQYRVHSAMKRELKMIHDLIRDYGPEEYPYDVEGDRKLIKQDFDDRVDVVPVSDPNSATQAQRIMQAQSAVQLNSILPGIADSKKLLRYSMEAMGVPDAKDIVPLDEDIKPYDSITENMRVLNLQPVKAFMHQDHEAHIRVHMLAMNDPKVISILGNSPIGAQAQAAMMSHIADHLGMMYRAEVEQRLGFQLPPPEEQMPPEVEVELSGLVVQAADQVFQKNLREEEMAKRAEEEADPMLQLEKDRIAIDMAKTQGKIEADMEKLDLERAKVLRQDEFDNKKLAIDTQLREAEMQARLLGDILDAASDTERINFESKVKLAEFAIEKVRMNLDAAKERMKGDAALGKSFNDSITKITDQLSKLEQKKADTELKMAQMRLRGI